MFSWTLNKRRPPDNFTYSHNLKIVSKSIEYLQLRKWRRWDTCAVIEDLALPWWCFLGLPWAPKPSLLCFSVVFLQECLKLPSPLLFCTSSCTTHPIQLSICGFWPIIPSAPVHSVKILTFFLTLYCSRFLLPSICLVLTSSYLIFAVHPPFKFLFPM